MLDWRGQIAECTGANIFFVKDGVLHTPTPDCFLDGITRRTVIGLAGRRGLKVVERTILPDELASFSECFVVGTAAEVTPVAEIAEHRYKPGKICETLINDYTAAVQPRQHAAE
jgi:branched-chain amino acid aminotransferase